MKADKDFFDQLRKEIENDTVLQEKSCATAENSTKDSKEIADLRAELTEKDKELAQLKEQLNNLKPSNDEKSNDFEREKAEWEENKKKEFAELEADNERLKAENDQLKNKKDEEKDGKVVDETAKQSILSTFLVAQLNRASKFDIGDRKTIFRFLSSVATNDMEWLSMDIFKEIDNLQFNNFDLNKIVKVFAQSGLTINQLNMGNGTQNPRLPSHEDNK